MASLAEFVGNCPIIDQHCHPLLDETSPCPDGSHFSLLAALSEASGQALLHARNSIAVKRAIRELCSFLGVPKPWSLEALESARGREGADAVRQRLFAECRIRALLLDDGLRMASPLPVDHHTALVPTSLRVVRVESLAEDILSESPPGGESWSLASFETKFWKILDPLPKNVVALKTIAAYRCGLDLLPSVAPAEADAGLQATLGSRRADGSLRVADRAFISFLVALALKLAHSHDIPLQVHSGFGDRDLDLRLANPLLLRPLLEQQERDGPCARIVLLHCSYPFCREAGFLASLYPNVFVDCGLVYGKLSFRGQLFSTESILELAPLDKVMFSTDAYAFADSFFLACTQGRAVLTRALEHTVQDGDLTPAEALEAAAQILHNNAVRVYHLSEKASIAPITPPSDGFVVAPITPPSHGFIAAPAAQPQAPGIPPGPSSGAALGVPPDPPSGGAAEESAGCQLVRLVFADMSGQRRTRVVPGARYKAVVEEQGVGITRGILGFASFADGPAPGCGFSATGEFRFVPDSRTLRRLPWCPSQSMVFVTAHSVPGSPSLCCPRATLTRLSNQLFLCHKFMLRAAFESEFTLLKSTSPSLVPVDRTLYCSTSAFDASARVMSEIVDSLHALHVPVEQIHSEAGRGQFEVSIAHAPALEAADNVLLVRETICAVARAHDQHATFLPSVFPGEASSGCHVHASIWRPEDNGTAATGSPGDRWVNAFTARGDATDAWGMSQQGSWFMAGVLEHLPALMAISCPLPNSYERLRPNTWAGVFQCWGAENREAAIRVAAPPMPSADDSSASPSDPLPVTNFEVKACDATSQPHLVLAAIIAAGMDGLARKLSLPAPIDVNPADLEGEEAVPRLPSSLDEAVAAFEADRALQEALGGEISQLVIAIRKAESSFYKGKAPEDVIPTLIHKY